MREMKGREGSLLVEDQCRSSVEVGWCKTAEDLPEETYTEKSLVDLLAQYVELMR